MVALRLRYAGLEPGACRLMKVSNVCAQTEFTLQGFSVQADMPQALPDATYVSRNAQIRSGPAVCPLFGRSRIVRSLGWNFGPLEIGDGALN